MVPLAALQLSARNPRRGDISVIRESLVANQQFAPIIVNRSTREVLAGNHRVLAARELGWREIAVCWVDVDDDAARRILLIDNRSSDVAGYDQAALAALLGDGGADLVGTGYDRADLDQLLDSLAAQLPIEDDDVPPLPTEPRTRVGDVVELGPHRLVCGDARDEELVAHLLAGEEAGCLVTDPPYGVDYEGKTRQRLRIRNDDRGVVERLLPAAFACVDARLSAGAPVYVFCPSGASLRGFLDAFVGVPWQHRQTLVWAKDAMVLGHADYHHRHELVLYGYKPATGKGRLGRGGAGWYGDNRQVSVLDVPRPRAAREHPTMKPPELVARFVGNSTRHGSFVLDPFAGSGSTMVACERLGRRARLVEIDPRYCDVIIDRYQRLCGRAREVA
jgi:site-specific DNA-methyltransferase (adenine-specific)